MIGYIMKNRQIAMGTETTGAPLTNGNTVQRFCQPGCQFLKIFANDGTTPPTRLNIVSNMLVIFRSFVFHALSCLKTAILNFY
jgi:hypothetical protein